MSFSFDVALWGAEEEQLSSSSKKKLYSSSDSSLFNSLGAAGLSFIRSADFCCRRALFLERKENVEVL